MRLGAPLAGPFDSPEQWATTVRAHGYAAAYCPVGLDASQATIDAYAAAAHAANIIIAEVGAWSNPLSPDATIRTAAIDRCIRSLELAERIGARCCVNIAGSRGQRWDGPHRDDLTEATFTLIVETVQHFIDTVQPTRTFFTLEPMPYMYPDSIESYQRLIEAIDRPAFAVHFDPANLINSPQRYVHNAAFIRDFVSAFGSAIKSVHAKDSLMQEKLTVHIDEVRPGLGTLDYAAFLQALTPLDRDLPVMLEHLPNQEEYHAAASYLRSVAAAQGIRLDGGV
jgi:sugar phosphate isomerase/epimerase